MDLLKALEGSAPLVGVTFALVEMCKRMGASGTKVLTALSVLIGLALGIGYQFTVRMPQTFADWFYICLYGLAIGLVATGVYKGVQSAAARPAQP